MPQLDDLEAPPDTKPSDVPPRRFMPASCASKKHATVTELEYEFVASH
jgi:hypothetical protein